MLTEVLGKTIPCDCGRDHLVGTRQAVVRRGAVADVGRVARDLGFHGPLLLVADPDTFAAAGKDTVDALKAARYSVDVFLLPEHPVAGPETISLVRARGVSYRELVAVGSGTVNDIVKSYAYELHKPYLAVGTALSMNGYTSAISALLEGGVKRTVTALPPQGVVIDLDVCAAAPRPMTLAGLGDMLSKPFSEADWRLAHHLDGGYHCPVPGDLLTDSFARMLGEAKGIGDSDPDAMESLADAILLSGISMAMAGVSSPASGGEHLISHYWDMMCYARGEHPYALHGAQVGVACCMVEPLHHAVQALSGKPIDIDALLARWPATLAELRSRVRVRHQALPADVVERIVLEAERKWRPPAAHRRRLEILAGSLDETLAHVGGALLENGAIRRALEQARAPSVPTDISPNLVGGLAEWAHVRDMRARYTILDFATDLGVL